MIKVGVDIDDTLCDFIGTLNQHFNTWHCTSFAVNDYVTTSFDKVWSISPEEAQSVITEFVFSSVDHLTPLPYAYDALKRLKDSGMYEFYAISARDTVLYPSTIAWMKVHYPGIFSGIELCNYYGTVEDTRRNKLSVCQQIGISVMIDDRPDTLSDRSIRTITYAQPWNVLSTNRVEDWSNIYRLLANGPICDINAKLATVSTAAIVIGVSGKIGSGKDTVFGIISKHFSSSKNVAFADRVKKVVSALTGCPLDMCYTREGKAFIPAGFEDTIGVLLQKVGKAMRETIHEDVWCDAVLRDPSLPKYSVITDCRFVNEVDNILALNGLIIRLEGDPARIRERNDDGRDLLHISETALDDYPFKYVIENNSTLELLERNVLAVVVPYLYGKMVW